MYIKLGNDSVYKVKNVRNLLDGENIILQAELDVGMNVSQNSVLKDFKTENLNKVGLYNDKNVLLELYTHFKEVTRAEKYFYGDSFIFTITLK